MSTEQFDLVVIGTGPAAGQVATQCADGGMSVAIVESQELGGTCALRGCNPKKVLVHAAELVDAVQCTQGRLIEAHDVRIPWNKLISFEQTFVQPIPENARTKYLEKGIRVFAEMARFLGPEIVAAGRHRLAAKHFVIATGGRPSPLSFPGADHVISSDRFLQLPYLPPRVVFLGGGYISFEFAHVAARAGAAVTILHRGRRPLEGFDPDLVGQLVTATRSIGIAVELGAEARSIRREADGSFVVTAIQNGTSAEFRTDLIVHGAGRVPALSELDLEAAAVQQQREGITVTDVLRSVSNRQVFAAGDCAASGQPKLTPVADVQGQAIAQTLLGNRDIRPEYGAVPRVVFTVPPMASIGLSEEDARSRGADFDIQAADTTGWSTNQKVRARVAGYKVLIDRETRRILGAHLIGPAADETINLFSVAITHNLSADALKSVLFAYPTFSADIRRMV